jgi:hypothetical protein
MALINEDKIRDIIIEINKTLDLTDNNEYYKEWFTYKFRQQHRRIDVYQIIRLMPENLLRKKIIIINATQERAIKELKEIEDKLCPF